MRKIETGKSKGKMRPQGLDPSVFVTTQGNKTLQQHKNQGIFTSSPFFKGEEFQISTIIMQDA